MRERDACSLSLSFLFFGDEEKQEEKRTAQFLNKKNDQKKKSIYYIFSSLPFSFFLSFLLLPFPCSLDLRVRIGVLLDFNNG